MGLSEMPTKLENRLSVMNFGILIGWMIVVKMAFGNQIKNLKNRNLVTFKKMDIIGYESASRLSVTYRVHATPKTNFFTGTYQWQT